MELGLEDKERHVLRPLHASDYDKGFMDLLAQLTDTGEPSRDSFMERLKELQSFGDNFHVLVMEDIVTHHLVASGTVFIEPKFTHDCGKVGHIEDVIVDRNARGQHFGKRLIDALVERCKSAGCYKVILDCNITNVPFYERCGFTKKELQMTKYF